jgi:hypothetical protein
MKRAALEDDSSPSPTPGCFRAARDDDVVAVYDLAADRYDVAGLIGAGAALKSSMLVAAPACWRAGCASSSPTSS